MLKQEELHWRRLADSLQPPITSTPCCPGKLATAQCALGLDSVATSLQDSVLGSNATTAETVLFCRSSPPKIIGVARGGQGRAFALPSLNFALPSKPSSYLNMNTTRSFHITYLRVVVLARGWLANEM